VHRKTNSRKPQKIGKSKSRLRRSTMGYFDEPFLENCEIMRKLSESDSSISSDMNLPT